VAAGLGGPPITCQGLTAAQHGPAAGGHRERCRARTGARL